MYNIWVGNVELCFGNVTITDEPREGEKVIINDEKSQKGRMKKPTKWEIRQAESVVV